MMMRQEVFVRDVAVMSALGNDVHEAAAGLRSALWSESYKTFLFGQTPTTRGYYALNTKAARNSFERKLEAVLESLVHRVGLSPAEWEKCALYMGSTSMNLTSWEGAFKEDTNVTTMASMDGYGEIGRKLAEKFGIGGEILLFSTACTSSANALLEASREIRSGEIERAIVMGFEFYNELTICGFEAMGLLGKEGCKPFDQERSGMVLGEGCAAVLLDSVSSKDGGILRMLGGSNLSDVHSITSHNVDGAIIARTLRDALEDAEVEADTITHIKAHATGSTYNDVAEGRGIRLVFPRPPEVFVLKAAVGHTLGACGALELALLYGTLQEGFIPETGGFETVDPEIGITPSRTKSAVSEGHFLLNHFGFAGSGVVLVVEYTQGCTA